MSSSVFADIGSFFGDIVRSFFPEEEIPTKKADAERFAIQPQSQEDIAAAEARISVEQQAAGKKSSKQAAAFLKSRNAQGFGSNPNKAKPFLLSL